MFGTVELPLFPKEARILSSRLAVLETAEELVFVNASGPLMCCGHEDKATKRLVGAMLLNLGLGKVDDLAQVLGTSRSRVYRNRQLYREGGLNALQDGRGSGSRAAHKLTEAVTAIAQRHLEEGCSMSETARRVGVSPRALSHAIERGQLKRPKRRQMPLGPRARAERDACNGAGAGTAVKRLEERAQAAAGALAEAEPHFEAVEGLANAGVLLALPAMLAEGLLSVAEQVYAPLKKGFYGLHSILLCLVMLALLRIKSLEQLSAHSPGELGLLLGLDRVPEVKTLRRKLEELGAQKNGAKFAAALAERWARDDPEELGMLYVDGHVNLYTGRKHPLPKTFVQKRRQCMPASTDTWVNNGASEPLFFVTSPTNAHLLSVLEQEVIPKAREQIRKISGKSRRLTLVFDREAWSPKSFRRWRGEEVDVITYRKGKQTPWPQSDYRTYTLERDGREIRYQLAERSVLILQGNRRQGAFWMREIRRLGKRGKQTSVLTTRQDLPAEIIADRMFARWRQENFFKYMEEEFNLDQLCTYDTEAADAQRLVPNPERRAIDKRLKATKARLGSAVAELRSAQKNHASAEKIAAQQHTIQTLEAELDGLIEKRKPMPTRVPLHTLHDTDRLVHHEIERKTITRLLKTLAYRSESCLARIVEPFFARRDDEIRAFLKSVFRLSGDLIPDYERCELHVRLYSLSNHRSQQALVALCERLNQQRILYPGTNLRITYEAIASH